jgi:hypothetical protein
MAHVNRVKIQTVVQAIAQRLIVAATLVAQARFAAIIAASATATIAIQIRVRVTPSAAYLTKVVMAMEAVTIIKLSNDC